MKFGLCLPIFANPGSLHFRTPGLHNVSWDLIKALSLYADQNGYHSLFIADHLILGQDNNIFDCISTLSAVSAITENCRLLPIHLCDSFRNPIFTAKQFLSINAISNGRVDLFYDYGWRKKEFELFGYDFSTADKRISAMIDSLEEIKKIFKTGKITDRMYGEVDLGFCKTLPKPEIWLGECDKLKMIDAIFKYADVFNSMPCSLSSLEKKIKVLLDYSEAESYNKLPFKISHETQVLVRNTDQELSEAVEDLIQKSKYNNSCHEDIYDQLSKVDPQFSRKCNLNDLKEKYLVGTPNEIKDKIQKLRGLGVDHLMLWPMDLPSMKTLELMDHAVG